MKTYTVKEIAMIFNTSEETVRRWIRSGELKATMDSRKNGCLVDEEVLKEFVKKKPKYAIPLMGSISGLTAASIIAPLGLVLAMKAKNKKKKETSDSKYEIEEPLKERIKIVKEKIKAKQNNIKIIQNEIKEETIELAYLQDMLKKIRKEKSEEGE